jgi:thiosulfate dehydrogenase
MKHSWLISLAAKSCAVALMAGPAGAAAERVDIDLTQWTPPDIATVGDDPFGELVKTGRALFTDTANEIGPRAPDPTRRFAGNNLACQNCHLQGGSQPYAMPLTGVWGQFPQYRAREGAVDTLEDRINGCMERSVNGRALPLESREMRAFLAYMRWLSTGIPDGAKLRGAGTLRINEPARAADLGHGAQVFSQTCAACHGADGRRRNEPPFNRRGLCEAHHAHRHDLQRPGAHGRGGLRCSGLSHRPEAAGEGKPR